MSSPEREAGSPAPRAEADRLAQREPAPRSGLCQRCGFPVPRRVMGCKNPCRNCGTVYPFGDCSD